RLVRLGVPSENRGPRWHVDERLADLALGVQIHIPIVMRAAGEEHRVADVAVAFALECDEITPRLEARLGDRAYPQVLLVRVPQDPIALEVALGDHMRAPPSPRITGTDIRS